MWDNEKEALLLNMLIITIEISYSFHIGQVTNFKLLPIVCAFACACASGSQNTFKRTTTNALYNIHLSLAPLLSKHVPGLITFYSPSNAQTCVLCPLYLCVWVFPISLSTCTFMRPKSLPQEENDYGNSPRRFMVISARVRKRWLLIG